MVGLEAISEKFGLLGIGRGQARRRRHPFEVINTVPKNVRVTVGEGGTTIPLVSNYFPLITPRNAIIYGYRVDFEPWIESSSVRRHLIFQNRELFGNAYVFDGGNEIKSLEELDSEITCSSGLRQPDDTRISITIRKTSIVPWEHPEMMRFYNTQMRRNLRSIGMMQIGRYYYDRNPIQSVTYRKCPNDGGISLKIWPGIMTAINEHDGGILVMSDAIDKIVRNETVHSLLVEIIRHSQRFREDAKCEIVGQVLMVNYNNKTYRIDDIIFDKNPTTYTFERGGQTITLKDYYREQYNVTIRDDRQPLLLVKPTERQKRGGQDEPIVLIPELCLLTGLTDQMRNDFDLRSEIGRHTRLDPATRETKLRNFMRSLATNNTVRSEMNSWNLGFQMSLIELPGRVLPAEKIYMLGEDDQNAIQYNQREESFQREIRSKNMRKPVGFDTWAIVCLRRDKQIVVEYCNTLRHVAEPLGVSLSEPKIFYLDNDRTSTFVEACRKIPGICQLVNVIVPNRSKDRYDAIKKIFCCEKPMASQVVTSSLLRKRNALQTQCTRVCIQMSVKLGAEAWAVHIPLKNMMVVGYDCCHDTVKKGSSVGAFVCSLNQPATRWYSRCSYHRSREEMSSNFAIHLIGGLKEYQSHNGRLPDRLIIYRDGVSEGQISYVYDFEMAQIKTALNSIIEPDKIKWSFIIVTKRGNTRFFYKLDPGTFVNPPSGTVVDTVVTRKERYDFYLISQSVQKGTVNPTMYNIIEDTTGWLPFHHQQLAYKLCHLYFNWTGTINVPAPCRYAHKLAYLTGTSLHREPDPRLSNYLFYL
ncbi:piwi-like protein 1 [Brevipalpus obovatus]|uniref:piwi-like protein 1 n=1 Tax=Brevipalpus obovatus TaxID=246614 RepID=UPI003D9E7828